jgi:transcriptional regulator with XRE-family HTH domain
MKTYKIGSRIKEYREAAGLSQAGLARKIGTTSYQISIYEADKQNMSLPRFVMICEALGVDMVEMVRNL